MKVVIAALWYPIAIARYFHKALVNMPEVDEVITVGPTSGPRIPWGNQFYYPEHAFYPDFETSKSPQEAGQEVDRLITTGQIEDVDLWLDVDAGFFVDCDMPWKHVGIMTDPHCLNYDRQRQVWDESFCMQSVYAQPGDHVLPYAYCEYTHYYEEGIEETYDVSDLGLRYLDRVIVAQALQAEGLRVLSKLGLIWDDYRRGLLSAPICFTWSSRQDAIARCWEALATKRLLVCNRVPGLREHFTEDEHYVGFSNHQEALEKVLYYDANPYEAQRIAQAGYEKVQGETYTARLRTVFETIGLKGD